MILTDPFIGVIKPSAYSKVAYNIFNQIYSKHQVAHTPMLRSNRLGIFYAPPNGPLLYPSGETEFAEDVIEKNCFHFNSDALLTLKDVVAFDVLPQMSIETIYYTPVDHIPITPGIPARLRTAFKVVAMSLFGKRQLEQHGIKCTFIPHGFDPQIYHPIEDRERCRRRFHIKPGEKVVGCVFHNQGRKHPDRLCMTAQRLYELYPELKKTARFFFWTNINKDIPLMPMMLNMGINEYVYWPGEDMYNAGLTEELMAELYNAMDIVYGCGAEGFWLPGLEAQACGKPVVHVDYAAASELVGSGYRARVADWDYNNYLGVKHPLVDVDDAARKIVKVLDGDPEKYKRKALRFVKNYTWEKIGKKWLDFLADCELELSPMLTKEGTKVWDQEVS